MSKPLQVLLLLIVMVMVLSPMVAFAQSALPPLLMKSDWEQHMLQWGRTHCEMLKGTSASSGEKLLGTYYDAERVYYQIADYTRDSYWLDCARAAEQVYRDGYLVPNNGGLPGYWVFPHGLWKDYKRTQDALSKSDLTLMATNAAYAYDGRTLGDLSDPGFSREVAYNLQSKILAKDLGASQFDASITRLAEEAFRHINAWFVTKTAAMIQPFMVALTSEALIMHYNKTGDSRVFPAVRLAMDYLWNNCWVPSAQAFLYVDRPVASEGGAAAVKPAPDLNLLIAPVFAWLYSQTGDTTWINRGDIIWMGGVANAFLGNGKQFNQNYRWSFDYLVWRNKAGQPFVTFSSTPPPSGGTTTTPSTPSGGGTSTPTAPSTSPGSSNGSSGSSNGSSGSTSGSSITPSIAPQTPTQEAPAAPRNPRSRKWYE